jgi:hypothetical protein
MSTIKDEPICGQPGCGGCPTVAEFDQMMAERRRTERMEANIILGLPHDFALDETPAPQATTFLDQYGYPHG